MATKFSELKIDELRAAAEAFGLDSDGNAETIIAELVETGTEWKDYVKMFTPKEGNVNKLEEAEDTTATDAITTSTIAGGPTYEQLVAEVERLKTEAEEASIVVKDEYPALGGNQQWLVKMVRDNPLFEIAGHRFTKDHPYALLDAEKAEIVLREEGFRQARPSEIEEYYA